MITELLQSDVVLFALAMLGIAVTSVAIVFDYLPRGETPSLASTPETYISEDRAA